MNVAIVGDHVLAGEGLAALLRQSRFNVSFCAVSEDWREGVASAKAPGLVIVASRLEAPAVEHLVAAVRQACPRGRIIFMALGRDEDAPLAALRAGADGALEGTADQARLLRCIKEVAGGELVLSGSMTRRLVREYTALSSPGKVSGEPRPARVLTAREQAILRLVSRGDSNRAIAYQLSVSEHTVRAHLRAIMRKLEVANRVQAAAVALRSGLAAS